jgi:hypothetical protein
MFILYAVTQLTEHDVRTKLKPLDLYCGRQAR